MADLVLRMQRSRLTFGKADAVQVSKLKVAVGERVVTLEELDGVGSGSCGEGRNDGVDGQKSRENRLGDHGGCWRRGLFESADAPDSRLAGGWRGRELHLLLF